MSMKLVCVATESNDFLENWKESASAWGFDFDIIGLNQPWEGFETKLKLVKQYLKNIHRNTIVAIVDSYDLLLCGPPSELVEKYNLLTGGHSLVVGGESICFLNAHKHNQYVNNSKYKFVNGGFVMGKPYQIELAYDYIIKETPYDDQLGMGRYFDQFPSRITVDGNQELVANASSVNEIELLTEGRLRHAETNSTPVVIHFPFMYKDLGRRSETFRSHILENYTPKNTGFYIEGFLKHIIKHGYHNPVYKPLVFGIPAGIISIILILRRLKRPNIQKEKRMSNNSSPQLSVQKVSNTGVSSLLSNSYVYHITAEILALAVLIFYIKFNNSKLLNKITRLSNRLDAQDKEIQDLKNLVYALVNSQNEHLEEEEQEEEEEV